MVLVTGSTGLVGGHLLIHLYLKKESVRALIRKSSNFNQLKLIAGYYGMEWSDIEESVEWVYGDMNDENSIRKACENVHTVYHCAAVVSFDSANREVLNDINVKGTEYICKAALEAAVSRFCMVSSIAAIGPCRSGNDEADELCIKAKVDAGSDYSVSKHLSEEIVWGYIGKGLPAVIVNPGVIIGVGLLDRGSMKIYETVKKGIPFYTDGGTGYVDVRDVTEIMMRLTALGISGERFILVGRNATYGELFFEIADAMAIRRPFIRLGKSVLSLIGKVSYIIQVCTGRKLKYTREVLLAALNRKYYSSDKIKKLLHYEFIPLRESIEDIARWLDVAG